MSLHRSLARGEGAVWTVKQDAVLKILPVYIAKVVLVA